MFKRSVVPALFASTAVLALALAAPSAAVSQTPAFAQTTAGSEATVSVANANGAADNGATATGPVEVLEAGGTVLDLKGAGFQSVTGGMGGIYVAFGWVSPDGAWAPSAGGTNGHDYKTAPDDEQADNDGYLKFVTFPGSQTEVAANGGVLNEDGTWATELAVPPAVFETIDRDGNPASVNCLEVTCGVITIGAHNIKNANNETFTPVKFVAAYTAAESTAEATTESADPSAEPSTESAEPSAEATTEPEAEKTDSPIDVGGPDPALEDGTNLPMVLAGVAVVLVGASIALRRFATRRLNGR